jgi:hypothetical protein
MTVSLYNIWIIFVSIVTVTAPLLGTLTGALVARLAVILIATFFSQVRDAALKIIIKKGG